MDRYFDMTCVSPIGHIVRVEIRGDRVRIKPLPQRGNGIPKPEAACAVAQIKDDAPLSGLPEIRRDLSLIVEQFKLLRIDVGVDIAGPQMR